MTKTLLSIGHGFSAQALADRLLPHGWRIIGTTRSAEKAQTVSKAGVEAVVYPGADLAALVPEATHILSSVGTAGSGDPIIPDIGSALATADHLKWVGYLSTTGVYGDFAGGWVDEDTPLRPSTRRGQLRLQAEEQWQAIPGVPLHIFRLAGIYGPGRGPFSKVRSGKARRVIKKDQVFSRIHVEDIAQILEASMLHPSPGGIYNVCDDDPAPPQDVLAYAAELLGVPLPEAVDFDTAEMTPMARSFYAENKRVRNDRIKRELGIVLKYPDYRAGLDDLLAREHASEASRGV